MGEFLYFMGEFLYFDFLTGFFAFKSTRNRSPSLGHFRVKKRTL